MSAVWSFLVDALLFPFTVFPRLAEEVVYGVRSAWWLVLGMLLILWWGVVLGFAVVETIHWTQRLHDRIRHRRWVRDTEHAVLTASPVPNTINEALAIWGEGEGLEPQ